MNNVLMTVLVLVFTLVSVPSRLKPLDLVWFIPVLCLLIYRMVSEKKYIQTEQAENADDSFVSFSKFVSMKAVDIIVCIFYCLFAYLIVSLCPKLKSPAIVEFPFFYFAGLNVFCSSAGCKVCKVRYTCTGLKDQLRIFLYNIIFLLPFYSVFTASELNFARNIYEKFCYFFLLVNLFIFLSRFFLSGKSLLDVVLKLHCCKIKEVRK